MLAAVYGVLKAGAVYVPLDPRAPKARLGAIASDCRARPHSSRPIPAHVAPPRDRWEALSDSPS